MVVGSNFFRNRHLDAKKLFRLGLRLHTSGTVFTAPMCRNPAVRSKPVRRNTRGPIATHEGTFFFGAYEALRLDQAITRRAIVPSQSQRDAAIESVPSNQRNAAGLALLDFIPTANVGSDLATSNILLAAPIRLKDDIDAFIFRIDHSGAGKERMHLAATMHLLKKPDSTRSTCFCHSRIFLASVATRQTVATKMPG